PSPWWNRPSMEVDRSPGNGKAVRQRIALWHRAIDEAAGYFFCFVRSDLSRLQQSSSPSPSEKSSRARPDFRRWCNSSTGNYVPPPLETWRVRKILVLDNRL